MKQKSRKIVKQHYITLIFLTLILILFGTEFTAALGGWGRSSDASEEADEGPGNVFSDQRIMTSDDVFNLVSVGKLNESISLAEDLLKTEQADETAALGRTNGVLAQIVNSVGSGMLFAQLGKSINTITRSDQVTAAVFVVGAFLFYALIFIFLKNVYSAAVRRVFLEARIYENVSFLDITYFAAVRKWFHASLVMLLKYFYKSLWNLTIIGGIIKDYSYFAVPFIVAENPTIPANKAVTLSRRMMNGHKLELFKYQLTMLGWVLLGLVTFGISDLVYGAAYRLACYTEFFAKIREEALKAGIEGTEYLDDRYLYEKADKILLYETYFDVIDEITVLHENRIILSGWRKKIADKFGIWIGSDREKKEYDEQEGRQFAITRYKLSMDGKAYPQWLDRLWRKKELDKLGHFTFIRSYPVWTLFLLFVAFCVVGWSWEVALHMMQTGQFANRGTLHGPWLPIYGTGGIIVLVLCSRFRRNPVVEFFMSILLCGILEYMSGWFLEARYHQRWWSYDGYFLNLHGRICAEGLLVFGIACCVVVYIIAPIFDFILSKVKTKILICVALVLAVLYGADAAYSSVYPNMAEGAIEAEEPAAEADTDVPAAVTDADAPQSSAEVAAAG